MAAVCRSSFIGCLGFVFSLFAYAETGGSISGKVADPAGEAVAEASITVRDTVTSATRQATTSADGIYAFPGLPIGKYQLSVDVSGFRRYQRKGLTIDPQTVLRVDIHLELGERKETVTVAEESVAVETANTGMGEVISGSTIAATPLNGRSFTDLLALQPGVAPMSSQQPNAVVMTGVASTPPSGDLNPGSLSVSGQRETANGFFVNGSNVEEDVNMGTAVIPNLDSISEFRILTNNFTAEYGNYSGGQILLVTKSGGNQFHGNLFEYFRNTGLDARSFFSDVRAKFNQNQFGGTFGGPIRREKVFFFADYQGARMIQGVNTGLISVPSSLNRSGNFSDLSSSLIGTVNGQFWADQLSKRLGYSVTPGEPYYTAGCVSSAQCVFPHAQIPQRGWSPTAQQLLRYVPQPNGAGNLFSTAAYNQRLQDDKGGLRLDGNTRLGLVSAYYFLDNYTLNNPYPTGQGGANVPGFNALNQGRAQLASLSDTKSFGASTVNDLHFSYLRNANAVGQPIGGVGRSLRSQGFTGIVPLDPAVEGVENISFNNFTLGVTTTGLKQYNNIYQAADNFSKVLGAHTIKLGGEVHFNQINTIPNVIYNGSQAYLGTETGVDFADFLLGIASTYTQGDARSFYERNKYAGLFLQDSWRFRSNLTLDFGVRWDGIFPWSEKYNQLQTLIPGQQSYVYPNAPRGLVFPGDKGVAAGLAPNRYRNFSPRLGLAYTPNFGDRWLQKIFGSGDKTSFRAGYGMFYTAFEGLSAGIMSANPPYGYTYTSPAPPLAATPFVTAASGFDNGQRFPLQRVPYGASADHPNTGVNWPQFEPLVGIPAFSPDNVVPYTENYMASLQRQFGDSALLSVSFVGSQAHHLLALVQANPGDPSLCLSLSQPGDVLPGTPTCGPFNESSTFLRANGQVVKGTRGPFPSEFGSVGYQKTMANSNYNAWEVSVRHKKGPLELLFAYTFSKSIDQSSSLAEPLNPVNYSLTRAVSAFDMKHNAVMSYQYNLPFSHWVHRWPMLTSGWSISGVSRFSTGLPVTLYNNNDTSLLGTIPNAINNNGVDTPNYIPGSLALNRDPRSGKPAFDTALFSLPSLGRLGTASRRSFYGPGIENFDMALLKNMRLMESKSLQFRLEAFNVFNHAQFYGAASVNGNISSTNFGQIVSAAAPRVLQIAAKFYF